MNKLAEYDESERGISSMPLVGEVYLNAPPGMMTHDGMTLPKGLNCFYSLGYTGRLTNWMTAMMFRCR